jgi:hypothetical protein
VTLVQTGAVYDPANGRETVTYAFSGTWLDAGGSLPDGNYSLKLTAALVQGGGPGGVGLAGDDHTETFWRLFGDVNGDGLIDATDYAQFLRRYHTRLNADGSVSPACGGTGGAPYRPLIVILTWAGLLPALFRTTANSLLAGTVASSVASSVFSCAASGFAGALPASSAVSAACRSFSNTR